MKTRSKMIALSTAALMAAAPLAAPIYAQAVNGAEILNEEALNPDASIAENAMKVQNLTTLVEALQTAGLAEELMGEGPYTVFAPTNDAFAKLPAEQVSELMLPENRETLRNILGAHVVRGEYTPEYIDELLSQDDIDRDPLPAGIEIGEEDQSVTLTTVSGDMIHIRKGTGSELILRDAASNVTTTLADNVQQSNGVLYFVDGVLMPALS
ncbi:fasciclin domain-containing protein [Celeribacter indicus]|uniref:Secreted surface protein n=1 Tax=Celeribacter indicus TaxID=1208324 RepID=A0A0B5E1H1_9RHOB|nr:fasciclin domain-containing protein [Celeribacter indicus]AJE47245.1 secreted surface protein [Celeribacter indicus]SDW01511.1 Uncaracterized surface protein containing fasciclin (FAS1) repeats [Celeribacter indicus]